MARVEEQSTTKRRAKSRIPTFTTIEEEAAFWDTHDTTQFEEEFEEVRDVKFVKAQPKQAITVRMERDTLIALKNQARGKGIGPSTLVRMWILERLRAEENSPPRPKAL